MQRDRQQGEPENGQESDLLEVMRVAAVVLDAEQRIKHFTRAGKQLLKLNPSDIDRSFSHVFLHFDGNDLSDDIRSVIEGGAQVERHLQHANGRYYLVRVLPFCQQADRVERAVLTFTDVSILKAKEDKQQGVAAFNESINRINKALHSLLDRHQILQKVVDEGARTLGCETAALSLRASGAWLVSNVHGMSPELVGMVISDEQNPHALETLKTRQPVAISNCFADLRCNLETMQRFSIRSVLAVPLVVQDQPLGVIFFNYHRAPHSFLEEEIQFSRQIAATASLALHNAQLFDENRAALSALRDSEAQLQKTMQAGRIFTCDWEVATDIVKRSPNCAEILGIDPASCMQDTGENYCQRIHPDDHAAFIELVRGLTPASPSYETRYRFAGDDGSYIWIEESGQAEFDEAGNLVRIRSVAGDITERMDALDKEKEAAASLAAAQSAIEIVDAMGEGVVLFRLDGTVTAINPAIEKFTQLGRQELVGGNIRSLVAQCMDGNDLMVMTSALDAAMRGGTPKLQPVALKPKDAARVTVSPSIAFITSAAGKPIRAVLTLKDVTELYQHGELLHQIFDNTHIQMVCLDNQFKVVRVNRAYADYNRKDAAFFCGKIYLDFCADRETRAVFQRALEAGASFTAFEKPMASPHDPATITYWDYSLLPLHDKTGERDGFLLCLLDVTGRVAARQQLVTTEQRYQELVDNANSIIMRVTQDQRIAFFNEYAQRFFGYAEDEVLGRSVVGTIVPEVDSGGHDLRKLMEDIAAAPETHQSHENENMCKDGRRMRVHWSNRALRDERGVVKELLCVGTDITECWQLHQEAESYRKRLQKLASRLTRQEEQSRRKIATDIHDSVVQSLSLAIIRLDTVLAELDKAGLAGQREKMESIRSLLEQGTTECRGLMEQLVPPLLYEAGLGAALRSFADGQVAHAAESRILVEIGDHCDAAMDDALRALLFQCVRELIMNALKYAGPCEIRVLLAFPEQQQILLQVQDNGRGFDPDKQDEGHDENGGGFGLFNIRERLRNLGGSLEIESEMGKGTTATIRVPAPTRKSMARP